MQGALEDRAKKTGRPSRLLLEMAFPGVFPDVPCFLYVNSLPSAEAEAK